MERRVLVLLNAQSPFYLFWANYTDWSSLDLYPVFCSINKPKYNLPFDFIQVRDISKYLSYPKMALHINKIVKNHDIDFIHSHFLLHHGLISSFANIPTVATLYGSDVYRLSKPITNCIRPLIDKIDLFHAQSPMTLSTLQRKYKIRSSKMYCKRWGIHPIYSSQPSTKKCEKTIYLSPRSMRPLYQIHRIIQAFEKARLPNSELILLQGFVNNDSSYVQRIKLMVEKSSTDIKIIPDLLSLEEIRELYWQADFTIQIPKHDQVALSIVESMSQGAVPILSPLTSYKRELSDDTVLYTPSVKSLQNTLTSTHNIDVDRFRQNGLNFVKGIGGFENNFNIIYKYALERLFSES